ncbi:RluA family pseudouridine synthase [uncultured Treponema sp.]|uniref:RluA family pseudouridine synthase n=1 Tax=uncultured Treponema sp. TaxID=162155 RepID=UPI0025DB22A1|nr:RluA family pseudouridine synthase [uncultured Treponema sp.]
MFPPFDEELAFKYCKEIISLLEEKKLSLVYTTEKISAERFANGIMIGVLVAKNSAQENKILFTVSGISRKIEGKFHDAIFVEPIVSSKKIMSALQKNDKEIHLLTEKLKVCSKDNLQVLQLRRSSLTSESLEKVHELYSFYCFDGKKRSLKQICKNHLPPTGTGDCCAPKLLNFAFKNNLTPLSMCEVFFGKSTEKKTSGCKYSPCDERCGLILPEILGLKILYRDNDMIVVNKQSGLLSVPGRGPEKQDCIVNRVKKLFPECIDQPSVHRLDMETSGLMILAFTKDAHRNLCRQFEEGLVQKKYVALLDGILAKKGIPQSGTMELYFRLDIENRPHQIWDSVYGKKAITEWKILDVEKYLSPLGNKKNVTRVLFIPHTGRTHQLRLASADSHGFGVPIIGDTLYGHCEPNERLMLHSCYIKFTHPSTGKIMEFNCESDF